MKRLAIVVVSFFFCLIAAEVFIRVAIRSDYLFSRLPLTSNAAWRLRWIKLHTQNRDTYYSFDQYDPLLGWRLKANMQGGKTGDGALTTNSRGIRANREYGYEKPPGIKRILIIGDSFTFGEEVNDQEVYPFLLEQMIPKSEVINLGVHGYGTDQMLLYLKEEGRKYKPDIVLVGFVSKDMERNLLSFRDYAKPKYELAGGKLILGNVPVPNPESVVRGEVFKSKLADIIEIYQNNRAWKSGTKQKEAELVTQALLGEMTTTIARMGATALFVYLPTAAESTQPDRANPAETLLFSFCAKNGISCTSMRGAFAKAQQEGIPLKSLGHWDAAGHQIVAAGIAAFLATQK